MKIICIKVDVDTYSGLKYGVPRILKLLKNFDIKATFYVSLGPDNSGKAAINLLKPSFLKKMLRTKAVRSYGIKTALYGTLLKAPLLFKLKEQLLSIEEDGHEVEFHAWDHRYWQDKILSSKKRDIERWFENGISVFYNIYGRFPLSFAAPGWICSKDGLDVIKSFGFIKFISLSRAKEPFIEKNTQLLEIPSNLPCLEENPKDFLNLTLDSIELTRYPVLPVHAEIEGGPFTGVFYELLTKLKEMKFEFLTMHDYYNFLKNEQLYIREFKIETLKGRAFECLV